MTSTTTATGYVAVVGNGNWIANIHSWTTWQSKPPKYHPGTSYWLWVCFWRTTTAAFANDVTVVDDLNSTVVRISSASCQGW
jgi:hypothetical protein